MAQLRSRRVRNAGMGRLVQQPTAWSPSDTSRPPEPSNATTPCWNNRPWRHNLHQTASGSPGAVHSGHKSIAEVQRYTRPTNQASLAREAMRKMLDRRKANGKPRGKVANRSLSDLILLHYFLAHPHRYGTSRGRTAIANASIASRRSGISLRQAVRNDYTGRKLAARTDTSARAY